ncbi:hypothetical protein BGZ65_006672, partial [Modicella reniformis]
AKWMARWQVQEPRWKPLFTDMAKSFYGRSSLQQTKRLLEVPSSVLIAALTTWNDNNPIQHARSSVFETVKDFERLDIKRKGRRLTTVFERDAPMALLTVKARKYIDSMALKEWIAKPTPSAIRLRAPIYKFIRFKDRKPWQDTNHTPLPDEQWDCFFADRLHSPYRYTNERHHLYLLAHHVYQTKPTANPPASDCRRHCAADGEFPAFESRVHAFHDCPEVPDLWDTCRGWVQKLEPELELSDNAATYCKFGDGEQIAEGVLIGKVMAAFRYRARTDWERARYKDRLRFTEEWNFSPHIRVAGGLIFDGIWGTTDNAATDEADEADEAEPGDGAAIGPQ